jgi:hypothetical protein
VSRCQRNESPLPLISVFFTRSLYFSIRVGPQLSSRGWVNCVPDPLLLRKSGSARNRIRDLWICGQVLWSLDHRDRFCQYTNICNKKEPKYYYEGYSESHHERAVDETSNENQMLVYENKYLHTQAASEHSLLRSWTCRIREYIFVCPCQGNLPPVNSATYWHILSTPHYCWRTVIRTSSSGM